MIKKQLHHWMAGLLVALSVVSAGAEIHTFIADDTYVHRNKVSQNFSASTVIQLRSSATNYERQGLMRFAVSGLDGTITGARLIFTSATQAGEVRVHEITDSAWEPASVTWDTRPQLGAVLGAENAVAGASFGVDLTGHVDGDGIYDFGLSTTVNRVGALQSEESGTGVVLEIETETGGAGDTRSFTPLDTFVQKNKGTVNFSTSANLQVRGSSRYERRTYLQFDLSAVSETIVGAQLNLWSETQDALVEVVRIDEMVDIATVTWNTMPESGAVLASATAAPGSSTTFDLSSHINQAGIWTIGVITPQNATGKFSSSEALDHKPELVITVGDEQVNHPPQFDALLDFAAGESDLAYSATLADKASDPDGDVLSFNKVAGPAWLLVAADGALSGTPGASDIGINLFTVSVEDGRGGLDTAQIEIEILDGFVNTPPEFSDAIVLSDAFVDQPYADALNAWATDADGDLLTFSKTSGPGWLVVNSDGTLSGMPSANDAGVASFVFRVEDGFDSAETAVDILVQTTGASSQTFPAEDTFVNERQPDVSFSTQPYMIVRHGPSRARSRESYLRFDLSSLSLVPERAVLRVYSETHAALVEVRDVSDSFDLQSVTWNTKPQAGAFVASGTASASGWFELDLSHYVTAAGVYTFVLTTDVDASGRLTASEAVDHHPELVVESRGAGDENTVLYADPFEIQLPWDTLYGDAVWAADPWDAPMIRPTRDQYAGAVPLPAEPHTQVLDLNGAAEALLGPAFYSEVLLDTLLQATLRTDPSRPQVDSDMQAAFYFNAVGKLVVRHALYDSAFGTASRKWTVLEHPAVAEGQWVRLKVEVNYLDDALRNDAFYRIELDGLVLNHATKAYSVLSPSSAGDLGGEWFLCANSGLGNGAGSSGFSSLVVDGIARLDDLTLSTKDPAAQVQYALGRRAGRPCLTQNRYGLTEWSSHTPFSVRAAFYRMVEKTTLNKEF